MNTAEDLAQRFPASVDHWQAASARASSSPHGSPGELRGTSTGDSGTRIHVEVNSISVEAYTFLPVPDDSMEESFPAQYSHLLLYIRADLHYGEQATEFVLTTQ
ncbi:hypothetical protein llap_4779 [Limosa lapponica baueri]|uniref:Uncharacterized protein n=1 Tax=Limosa lapponica baueri TaxID=1758121 RepID=A0A2I0UFU3_LIMLA|nr:hypothetical protein llap_4779 [Limosa lapponica baueri]